jgi:hypothetical protein
MARITRVRGLAVLGAGGLTAAVAAVVSAVAPGHTLAKASTHARTAVARRGAVAPVRTAVMPPLDSARQLGLRAPSSTPQSATPSAPAQSAPAQSAPAQSAPAQSAPAQSAPAPSAPSQSSAPPSQPAPAAVSGGS